MKNKFFILFLSAFLLASCKGEFLDNEGKIDNMPYEEMHALANNLSEKLIHTPEKGFENFLSYYTRADVPLKSYLLATLQRTALASDNTYLRQQTTHLMLDITRTESEIQFINQALDGLQNFSERDFTSETKVILEKMEIADSQELIKITGAANIQSRVKDLQEIATSSSLPKSQWAATLALARMGDVQKLEEIIQRVKTSTDIIERSGRLFDELAWTKKQEAFNVLREYLYSQAYLPSVRDHDKPGTPEAVYAARAFARHIRNCPPIKHDLPDKQELTDIIYWAKEQKEWQIN